MAIKMEIRQRIIEMRAEGNSYREIAKAVGVAKQTAVDVVAADSDAVATLRGIEEEAFLEARRINRRGRLEQLAALNDRIREEIERRDLTDVPTDKLVTLFIKTQDALKEEVYVPTIQSTEAQKQAKAERNMCWDIVTSSVSR